MKHKTGADQLAFIWCMFLKLKEQWNLQTERCTNQNVSNKKRTSFSYE